MPTSQPRKIADAVVVLSVGWVLTACGGAESTPATDTTRSGADIARGQRVSIQMRLRQATFPDWEGTFTLTPLTPGKVGRHEGTVVSPGGMSVSEGMRAGQSYYSDRGIDTLSSPMGTLKIRWTQTILSAGLEYSVTTGTWKVVAGTGAYKGITGRGGLAGVIGEESHMGQVRFEGLLNVPGM